LNFTESLLEPLTDSSLTMKAENDPVQFSVTQFTLSDYSLTLENLNVTKQAIEVFLLFNEGITSFKNSLLIKRDYNCTVILHRVNNKGVPVFVKAMSRSVASMVTASAAFSVISNTKIGSAWIFLNTIQVLSYLPLINIEMPNRLSEFLQGVNPLGSLPNLWDFVQTFNCDSPDLNPKFYDYGFTCKHFIYNTGELLLCFLIGILAFFLLLVLYISKCKYCRNVLTSKLGSYKWAYFYRFWMQSYIELAFPVVVSLNTVYSI